MINELESLYRIKQIQGVGSKSDKQLLTPIINSISKKTCINREMPDIQGNDFGIEHTEISPFFEHRKKGDSYRSFKNIFKSSLKKIDFPIFEYHFLDLSSFIEKLGIKQNHWLVNNAVNAILGKSKKFLKYEKFKLNGLWISYPNYLSFTKNQEIPFLIQEPIFDAIMKSPFDFFMFGNENKINIVTKDELFRQYKNKTEMDDIVLTIVETDEFPLFMIKCKTLPEHMKSERFKMGSDVQHDLYLISKDLNVPHSSRLFLEFEQPCAQTPIARLFSDDIELEVNDWKHEGGMFSVEFSSSHLSGTLVTNFIDEVRIDFTKLTLMNNESINITPSQYNDSLKQKILTGTKRFVLFTERKANIYTTPPIYKGKFHRL